MSDYNAYLARRNAIQTTSTSTVPYATLDAAFARCEPGTSNRVALDDLRVLLFGWSHEEQSEAIIRACIDGRYWLESAESHLTPALAAAAVGVGADRYHYLSRR